MRIPLVIAFAFMGLAASGAEAKPWAEGDPLPDLGSFKLDGEVPPLEGKVVYLDFWASWCAPCKASFPELEKLYLKYRDKGFVVLAVSVDDRKEAMDKFVARQKPSFPTVLDVSKSLVDSAAVQVMPTSYLVDRKGIIRAVRAGWSGKRSVEILERELNAVLKEEL